MIPETTLSGKAHLADVRQIAQWAVLTAANKERLWQMASSANRLAGVNALWALTHLPASESEWLGLHQSELTDMLLTEEDVAKKRLLLQLLKRLEYRPDTMRTDLLDYCLSKINSECETHSVRAFSIYVAFKMCRFFPELLVELNGHLAMLSLQKLSPGLDCARRKTLAAINRSLDH